MTWQTVTPLCLLETLPGSWWWWWGMDGFVTTQDPLLLGATLQAALSGLAGQDTHYHRQSFAQKR